MSCLTRASFAFTLNESGKKGNFKVGDNAKDTWGPVIRAKVAEFAFMRESRLAFSRKLAEDTGRVIC